MCKTILHTQGALDFWPLAVTVVDQRLMSGCVALRASCFTGEAAIEHVLSWLATTAFAPQTQVKMVQVSGKALSWDPSSPHSF